MRTLIIFQLIAFIIFYSNPISSLACTEFRVEAKERITLYREATGNEKAEKELLDWLAEKLLESYRNGQEQPKGKQAQKR